MYQVIFSINNNEEVMVLPAAPPDLGPQIPQNNGTFEGISRDYNTLGTMGLWEMNIESFFPVGRRYSFMPVEAAEDGWRYVDFFQRNRLRLLPFRIIILDGQGVCRLNSPCSVDDFFWRVKRNGDIAYSLTLREYRFISGVT